MANAEVKEQKNIAQELKEVFGAVSAAEDTETKKFPVMSFSQGGVYLGLKLVSVFDKSKNVRRDPTPRITASFGGTFVEVPLNGKWWRAYADFVGKMAQAMDGVDLSNSNINDDVAYAQNIMAKFRNQS